MYQDIIALIIVAAAVFYAVFSAIRRKRKRRPASCGDCTGCSCDLAKLKEECGERSKLPGR